jgi:histidine ammonia-lyase
MRSRRQAAHHRLPEALLCLAMSCAAVPSLALGSYTPISPSMSDRTVTLTGHDLSIEQIVMVARYGAKVELSPEARVHEADNYGLLLEASAEGIPVYWFNRGVGRQRETVLFEGDPLQPQTRALIEKTQLDNFRTGAAYGTGPEVDAEEIVRAMMVVRANAMVFNAPSPQLAQMLLDLLNHRVTPVVQSRGTLGEGDLAQLSNVGQTMIGVGEAYLAGVRMPADQALKRAGLTPLRPFGADDNALTSSNAYATGQAALLVHDAEAALGWADLIYAMDLNGMNSSITPLSRGVQRDRPDPWLNWHAARTLDMIRGSYLFEADPNRIIQDPESLRASSIRQASAWEQWSALSQAVVFQANSSDHNPAVSVGLGPEDSWELATPQMMRFFVKGGPHSHGQHGYIVSNANWDPYPMANQVESFIIALANMDIAVMLRIERFKNPFFTGVTAASVIPGADEDQYDYNPVDLEQEVQSLMAPVAPFGSAIVATVEDLQSQTRIKLQRARQAVAVTMDLLSFDLLEATLWMNVRAAQDPQRKFGPAATAAWSAFRQLQALPPSAAQFLRTTPASKFYQGVPVPLVPVPPP